jgi:hypothetical protein
VWDAYKEANGKAAVARPKVKVKAKAVKEAPPAPEPATPGAPAAAAPDAPAEASHTAEAEAEA